MDCSFCSQSKHHNTAIETFPLLSSEQLLATIASLAATPIKHIGIVTSGSALQPQELSKLIELIASLPQETKQKICGSLGRLDLNSLTQLHTVGMQRYHHNLETSESFYPQVCTTQTWQQRLETVQRAKAVGLETCTGGLFGLGETWEDRIVFALRLRAEGITNIPMNFLYAHPGTPLAKIPPLTAGEALRCITLWRHLLPTATLRICGGRPTILGERQAELFRAGANALMTGNYLTTTGQSIATDLQMIAAQDLKLTN